MIRTIAAFLVAGVLCAVPGAAGQAPAMPRDAAELPADFDGPPAPVFPAVISRDASGRATVRAVRISVPLRLDGRLDEAFYATATAMSDFIQSAPDEGAPATEKTEVWLAFDRNNVYFSVRCWETHPERIVASEMRRDNTTVFAGSDAVGFIFDTFYDRRNGALFTVNAVGGLADGQVTNEAVYNANWNPIWDAKVARFEGGWSLEAAIPFKSLRYQPGAGQIWGFNVRRVNKAKNEESFLTRIPIAKLQQAILQSSLAATVVGLEAPSGARNLDIKPYLTSNLATDLNAAPQVVRNDVKGDFGLDVKYGISQNLTTDFTYNTDFAQVEADEQQVNLTRFSLFFPEKREFFLENQGLFDFGGVQATSSAGDTPIVFYSRRIGLNEGRPVPIDVGGRLTGRLNRYSFGVLNIESGAEPITGARRTNSSVVRLKRDIWRRSSVGLLMTGRSVSQQHVGSNVALGVDGSFAFFENLTLNTFWARTITAGLAGNDTSYRAHLNYAGDRYGLQIERLGIGDNFNPELGFVRRDDLRRSYGQVRFSPRLRSHKIIRRLSWIGGLTYAENASGRVDTRTQEGEFAIEFHNGDRFVTDYGDEHEYLPTRFPIANDVVLPVGAYDFGSGRVAYTLGQQRRVSGTLTYERGSFYSGHKTTWSVSRGRISLTRQVTVEPSYSVNLVDLVEGSFTTHLAGSRVTYAMTPRMFASALIQFNSDGRLMASNARLRWEYQPGSEVFVVYNEERNTRALRFPDLATRSFVVKINRMFRF